MKISPKILELPPRPAVRLLALTQLKQIRATAVQLEAGEAAALHDFRISLRRLRTTLKTFRAELEGSVRRGDRRALRRLSRLSNRRRDFEAQLALLDSFEPTPTVAAVRAQLLNGFTEADAADKDVVKAFRALDPRLRRRLRRHRETLDPDNIPEPVAFESLLAAKGIELTSAAMLALDAIELAEDARALHAARLQVKRVRYTIEPLRAFNMTVLDASARLRRVQDLLGGLRDHAQLLATIAAMLASPDEQAMLDEFAGAVRQRAAELSSELQRLWLYGNSKWFFQRLLKALNAIARAEAAPTIRRPAPRVARNLWRDPSSA